MKTIEGALTVSGAKFCVVVSRWNSFIVDSLEELTRIKPKALVRKRYERFRRLGSYLEAAADED